MAFVLFATIVVASYLLDRRGGGNGGENSVSSTFQLSPDGARLEMVTVMNQTRRSSEAGALREGKVVTLFGDSSLDLTRARLSGESGRMEVVVMAGHARITVPPQWRVNVDDKVALGRVENRADKAEVDSPQTVHLVAVVFGGELEVSH